MLIIEVVYLAFAYTTASAYRDAQSQTPLVREAKDLTLSASLLVFLLYWTLIYDGGTPRPITPFTHGYNFAMAVDQLLTNQPVSLARSRGTSCILSATRYSIVVWSVHFLRLGPAMRRRAVHLRQCDVSPCDRTSSDPSEPGSIGRNLIRTALTAAIILLVVCPLVYCLRGVLRPADAKVENDDLNRRASGDEHRARPAEIVHQLRQPPRQSGVVDGA